MAILNAYSRIPLLQLTHCLQISEANANYVIQQHFP
jgi:hypothetical protein